MFVVDANGGNELSNIKAGTERRGRTADGFARGDIFGGGDTRDERGAGDSGHGVNQRRCVQHGMRTGEDASWYSCHLPAHKRLFLLVRFGGYFGTNNLPITRQFHRINPFLVFFFLGNVSSSFRNAPRKPRRTTIRTQNNPLFGRDGR